MIFTQDLVGRRVVWSVRRETWFIGTQTFRFEGTVLAVTVDGQMAKVGFGLFSSKWIESQFLLPVHVPVKKPAYPYDAEEWTDAKA